MITSSSRLAAAILLLAGILFSPAVTFAHPMGNFSISHHAGIRVGKNTVELRYLIDMAEIPTFQEIQETGIIAEAGHASVDHYLARRVEDLRENLTLEINGRRLALKTEAKEVLFTPGAGALPTMKIGAIYRAEFDAKGGVRLNELYYADHNFPDRAGWKEIVAASGPEIDFIISSAPAHDRSRELSD